MPPPRRYKTAKALGSKLDRYFEQCQPNNPDGQWPNDDDMALFCGFLDPDSFDEYVKMSQKPGEKQDYTPFVKRAKARLRASYKERLNHRETSRGAEFVLSACYGLSPRSVQATEDLDKDKPNVEDEQAITLIAHKFNRKKADKGAKKAV